MKKLLFILCLLLSSSAYAEYEQYFTEYRDGKTLSYKMKVDLAAVADKDIFEFDIGDIMFKVGYSRSEELVLLYRFDNLELRWRWVLVGEVAQLERDCKVEGTGEQCSKLIIYMTEFYERATSILQRDYGGVVIIPTSWEDGLDYLISNNSSFDEQNLVLSISN